MIPNTRFHDDDQKLRGARLLLALPLLAALAGALVTGRGPGAEELLGGAWEDPLDQSWADGEAEDYEEELEPEPGRWLRLGEGGRAADEDLEGIEEAAPAWAPGGQAAAPRRLAQAAYANFRSTYNPYGRDAPFLGAPQEVLLQFEIQRSQLEVTPSLLVAQKGFDLGDTWCEEGIRGPLFGRVSERFSTSVDGAGCQSYLCAFGPQLEIETEAMRPARFLESSFLNELHDFMAQLQVGSAVPGTQGRVVVRSGAKTYLQYSVGLPFRLLPTLLAGSHASAFWERASEILQARPQDYRALVSLAAMTLNSTGTPWIRHMQFVRGQARKTYHAKAYLEPWLVRTHFGDMARYVMDQEGAEVFRAFPEDVLQVAGFQGYPEVFQHGLSDYPHFVEILEQAGAVAARDSRLAPLHRPPLEIPTTPEAVCRAARFLLERPELARNCERFAAGVYPAGVTAGAAARYRPATAEQWLKGIPQGHDYWSDGESILANVSFSKTIFKSMGSWRMRRPGYVYLESRHRIKSPNAGLRLRHSSSKNPLRHLAEVAKGVLELFGDQ